MKQSHIVMVGETPYAHERAAIDHAIEVLPNSDPYHLWGLLELLEPSSGRLYEIDMLVLGYSALYLVEVKSGPGKYVGDSVDWHRIGEDGRPRWMEPPLRLANLKAKVLKSRLQHKIKDPRLIPWIQPLIFLSAPEDELDVQLRADGRVAVVTRDQFRDAILKHRFLGARPDWRAKKINAPQIRALAAALEAIGIKKREGQAFAGQYALGEVLAEGPGYQDRIAVHRGNEAIRGRGRIYLVPQQTSVERRQQLHRAAERESQLLYDVREHPNILNFGSYERDAPLGPTVIFDAFEDGVPLDAFIRQNPDLPFQDRVELVCQIGRALAFCHKKRIVHRALSPEAVLVRRNPDTDQIETRLFNFQLAEGERVSATRHWSQLASEPWSIYQAPELREDPENAGEPTDIFSLGAIAYFVFTGTPPGENFVEVEERLMRDGHLDAGAAAGAQGGELFEEAGYFVEETTRLSPALRTTEIEALIELLADASKPSDKADTPEIDPLEATRGEQIGGNLRVEAVLGHGATSRVLRVLRESDDRVYALKVSLSEDHDARLSDEAAALAGLRHPRIIQLIDEQTIGGRKCLLVTLAGDRTLQRYLSQEGSVSLDYASRFGEDLLSALEHLEEENIVHRDIKPANVGVGAPTKKEIRLTLFDFSLVRSATTDVGVGTSAYRDPFLRQRGRWDFAADRWSAAVTLHEMLTGVRPGLPDGVLAIDPAARVAISAERFDSSVRDRLQVFFEQALGRDLERRFESAKAMRRAWERCFATPSVRPRPAEQAAEQAREKGRLEAEEAPLSDAAIAAIAPATPIEALPLSTRARNALDRAGLVTAEDLLSLPDNRLSAVRGVGSLVARDVLEFRDRWRRLRSLEATSATPFFPGYRGEDLLVTTVGLEPTTATALHDAGLRTLATLATAPVEQINALSIKHGFDTKPLRTTLEAKGRAAKQKDKPSSIEAWVDALLPRIKKRAKYAEALFGLSDPFTGRLDVGAKEVAQHFGKTRANIYLALSGLRETWQQHGAMSDLRASVRSIVEDAGGAISIERAAELLERVLSFDKTAPSELTRARAAALARIVTEVEKDEPEGLRYVRIRRSAPWLMQSDAHGQAARALGDAADELADRAVVAPPGEAARTLKERAEGTPLEALSAERLARIGAEASEHAACSTRLEIYPREMPAERALDLSSALLRTDLSPEQVKSKVSARYPDAAPLPPRPALDELLRAHRLEWNEVKGAYTRPGDAPLATLQTNYASYTRVSRLADEDIDARKIAAKDFDDRLKNTVERRAFRVLGVSAVRARDAALCLAARLGVEAVCFDLALIEEMNRLSTERGVKESAIHSADLAAGTAPETWHRLTTLAADAAHRLAGRLFPPKQPLLIVQPGLIARYELEGFLDQLRNAAESQEAAAIFLLVPSRDTGRAPLISGEMAVRGAKSIWIPGAWIAEAQKAA